MGFLEKIDGREGWEGQGRGGKEGEGKAGARACPYT